jgi:hypothetical protein
MLLLVLLHKLTRQMCVPAGCARSAITVAASAQGAAASASASVNFVAESEICSANDSPVTLATLYANAFATAVATATIQYSAHVCSCCIGNSAAYGAISASVQASATAYAQAFIDAVASVSCYGELLAGASSILQAVAQDTQVAIASVHKKYVSVKGADCVSTGLQTEQWPRQWPAPSCRFVRPTIGQ